MEFGSYMQAWQGGGILGSFRTNHDGDDNGNVFLWESPSRPTMICDDFNKPPSAFSHTAQRNNVSIMRRACPHLTLHKSHQFSIWFRTVHRSNSGSETRNTIRKHSTISSETMKTRHIYTQYEHADASMPWTVFGYLERKLPQQPLCFFAQRKPIYLVSPVYVGYSLFVSRFVKENWRPSCPCRLDPLWLEQPCLISTTPNIRVCK